MSKQTDIRTKIEALLGTSKKQNLLVCTCQYGYCPKCYVDYLESLVRASVGLVEAADLMQYHNSDCIDFIDGSYESLSETDDCECGAHALRTALAQFAAEVEKAGKS